jgi:hypothetical protein
VRKRKKSYKRREKRLRKSVEWESPTRQQLQLIICHQLPSSLLYRFAITGKHSFLFRVVHKFYLVFSWWPVIFDN